MFDAEVTEGGILGPLFPISVNFQLFYFTISYQMESKIKLRLGTITIPFVNLVKDLGPIIDSKL